jgi:hypothetical protein
LIEKTVLWNRDCICPHTLPICFLAENLLPYYPLMIYAF